MSEHLTRKELKQPDAFQKVGGTASQWLIDRQKLVAGLALGLLLLGAGVSLASYFGDRNQSEASNALGTALAVLDRPVAGTPGGRSDLPPFATESERREALIKALSDFRSSHGKSASSTTASLVLAQTLLLQGKLDEALATYDDYLKTAGQESPLRAIALEGRGYAFEAQGKLDDAYAAFEQLGREGRTKLLEGMGLYHQARIRILQGKKEEAAKQLSEISGAAPDSAASRLAAERLAALAAEGIKPPQAVVLPPAAATDAG